MFCGAEMPHFYCYDNLYPTDETEKWGDDRINEKKEILAYDLATLFHGEEEAEEARTAAKNLFGGVKIMEHLYEQIWDKIREADAVLIGASNELSISEDYNIFVDDWFQEYFRDFRKNMGYEACCRAYS